MYSFFIMIFQAAVHIASLFNRKAALLVEGHKNLLERISDRMAEIRKEKNDAKTYLFHCASLGEFEQGRPLLEGVRRREPGSVIILTFFSPSGYESKHDYKEADAVFYLPFDTAIATRKFVDSVKPDIAVIVKYEYWRNLFKALRKCGTSIFIISALFQEDMSFFNPIWGGFFIYPLKFVNRFFVQDEHSVALLRKIGFDNATVLGDTRFDRVCDILTAKPSPRVDFLEGFISYDRKKFVAGSVWESDMKRIIPFIASHKDVQYIIAPHNIHPEQIDRWISSLPEDLSAAKFTSIEKGEVTGNFDVIFIDCVGMLSQVYKFADVAFIGGGYDKLGIHNVLEAAVWSKPVIFGPVYSRYIEAVGLVACKGAMVARTTAELSRLWTILTEDGGIHGKNAGNFVLENSGVTAKLLKEI